MRECYGQESRILLGENNMSDNCRCDGHNRLKNVVIWIFKLIRIQDPREIGIISQQLLIVSWPDMQGIVCIKRRLPIRLYAVCLTVTMTTRKSFG